jgi:hypothetical protein
MHIVIYAVTVSIFLVCGLFGLTAVLEPVDGMPNMRMGMAAKSVPTTTEEMAARARENAMVIADEFKRRNPPQPPAVITAAVEKPAKTVAEHSARKKVRVAHRNQPQAPRTALSFQGGLD